jgi:hypothetical protein
MAKVTDVMDTAARIALCVLAIQALVLAFASHTPLAFIAFPLGEVIVPDLGLPRMIVTLEVGIALLGVVYVPFLLARGLVYASKQVLSRK